MASICLAFASGVGPSLLNRQYSINNQAHRSRRTSEHSVSNRGRLLLPQGHLVRFGFA